MVTRQSQAAINRVHAVQPAKPNRSVPLARGANSPNMGNQAAQRLLRAGVVQAKLTVNQPGDRFEQEADQVAEKVIRIQAATDGVPPRIQRMCSECEEELHRKAGPGVEAVGDGFKHPTSGGRPLPHSERRFFEPRFGQDLSHVRLHTNAQANEAARAFNALAYTMRNDIVFADGQYRPGSDSGRRLLAHELVHTIQQVGAGERMVQRRIGEGHDLNSPRFAGDLVLEAVNDDERQLESGDKGAAVRKLQQALVDADFSLPRFGVDGDFGPETKAAVEAFQRASGLTGSNIDGIVGPITLGLLDQRFFAGLTPAGTRPGKPISPIISPPPAPAPYCPSVPTATPPLCTGRNTAYCDAAICFPSNSWLPCVCRASGELCRAVDAFSFTGLEGTLLGTCAFIPGAPAPIYRPILEKAAWFLSTNRCIWKHWRAALDAIHDPMLPVPGGLTAEWSAAVPTCRSKGIASKDCCKAHVKAEQTAIDHCGLYDSAKFGLLPTDVPGAPACSKIVAAFAPPPSFTGDFGNVSDRISYGNSRCCK